MQNFNNTDIGNKLYEIRTLNNLSEQALAWTLGIDAQLYREYEIGVTEIPCSFIYAFCRYFDISADDIVFPKAPKNNRKTYKFEVTFWEE